MKNKIIFVVGMLVLVLVLIYVVSLTNTNQSSTEGVKVKEAPQAYINKEKPTAIYIEGNPEPVLRIEDLPKEFPSHIHHMQGATPRDGGRFYLASFSLDGQRIAFSCGGGHEWVGVFELASKKLSFITWLFDIHVDHVIWSSNSRYFAYTYTALNGEDVVNIVGWREKTAEPYISNHWRSGTDTPITPFDFSWTADGESLQFQIPNYEIIGKEKIKIDTLHSQLVTMNAVKQTEEALKESPQKVKRKE